MLSRISCPGENGDEQFVLEKCRPCAENALEKYRAYVKHCGIQRQKKSPGDLPPTQRAIFHTLVIKKNAQYGAKNSVSQTYLAYTVYV
jgi:hypothetical protein